jgi:hypothetical protein
VLRTHILLIVAMTVQPAGLLFALFALLRHIDGAPPATRIQLAPDIARLAWMAGCWEQRTARAVTHEQWMPPAGGVMIGMSRTVSGGEARSWEFLRVATVNGTLAYVAQPSGQGETIFPATAVSDTLATFENPSHDFPQRIAYRRVRADSIVARISGVTAGKERGMDIPFRRCTSAS